MFNANVFANLAADEEPQPKPQVTVSKDFEDAKNVVAKGARDNRSHKEKQHTRKRAFDRKSGQGRNDNRKGTFYRDNQNRDEDKAGFERKSQAENNQDVVPQEKVFSYEHFQQNRKRVVLKKKN
eukprot:TRINITY_DN2371_c0_g2_i1.p1 TRINITY_DN2371_c0_g2~~TRINITY_DN2371_c0_g2_i1.p1  ORF type:complete len:124 (-),score=38.87 TRINITY_DN2371_c0_g2_i1:135-506(-)